MKLTTLEKQSLIGKSGLLTSEKLKFTVTILAFRESFGRTDAQIKPLAGEGVKWVSFDNLEVKQ